MALVLASGSRAFALCGSIDDKGNSNVGTALTQHFIYRFDDTWKKVAKMPVEVEPDGGEVAWLSTDSRGWSLAWIFISSPDWIWTTTYCYSPSKALVEAQSRFSCSYGWIAVQKTALSNGNPQKSATNFIDNKTLKSIPKPDDAEDFSADFEGFTIYRRQSDLPFAKLLSKTGVRK